MSCCMRDSRVVRRCSTDRSRSWSSASVSWAICCLSGQHLGFQGSQPLDLVRFMHVGHGQRTGTGCRFPFLFRHREGLHLRGNESRRGCIQQPRCLERTAMQAGYLVQVFLHHTFDPCVPRMGSQGHIRLFEPVVEGLGMNAKQTSTVCDRKKSHTQNPFRRKKRWETRRNGYPSTLALPGNFLEVGETSARQNKAEETGVRTSQE